MQPVPSQTDLPSFTKESQMNGQPASIQARIAGNAAVRDYEEKQQKCVLGMTD
jgi:hypothetical protein